MKTGRPRKEIDFQELDKLCGLQCTADEIAGWFGVSVDTIERRILEETGQSFAEFYKEHSAGGRISLRRKQFQIAMTGNVGLLIWLGKQYLGQKNTFMDFQVEKEDDKLVIRMDGNDDVSGAV